MDCHEGDEEASGCWNKGGGSGSGVSFTFLRKDEPRANTVLYDWTF